MTIRHPLLATSVLTICSIGLVHCGSSTSNSSNGGPSKTSKPPPVQVTPSTDFTKPTVIPNRDSAVVSFGPVDTAKDYRMFAIKDGVTLSTDADGGEIVEGATIFCAGNEQHNLTKEESPKKPLRLIEVTGLTEPVEMVLEALDEPCPFPGLIGSMHQEINTEEGGIVPIYSEDEVRQKYGSLIYNGQGEGTSLAAQAPNNAPRVLAKTTVRLEPLGYGGEAPAKQFFEDWTDDADQPRWIEEPYAVTAHPHPGGSVTAYQNSRWNFLYVEGFFMWPGGAQGPRGTQTAFHIGGGRMRNNIADFDGNFASQLMIPKQTVAVSDTDYLHVTYEVDSNTTQRRYWWVGLCGADQAGQTLRPDGQLVGDIMLSPFFYLPDGHNPAMARWNCIQVFTLFGTEFLLPPDNTRPQSDLVVILNKANEDTSSVIQVGDFHRELDENGKAIDVMLDDRLFPAVRTRFDLYIRRNRLIVYAAGKQKACTDFPSTPLTMAEGALAYGGVLYHATADHYDLEAHKATAQYHYFSNIPWMDQRQWDNMGYDERVGPPSNFNEARCKAYKGMQPPL
jgi:hypothetical protein